MRIPCVIRISVALALTMTISALAKDYKGIVMLRSTCADVKRILGVAECKPSLSPYYLKDETLTLRFSQSPCPKGLLYRQKGALEAPGVVTGITRQLYKTPAFAEFNIDVSKFQKSYTDFIGEVIYSNKEEGIQYRVVDEVVHSITYWPTKEDERLRCTRLNRKR